jgi:uncharacterized membrane protein YfcA
MPSADTALTVAFILFAGFLLQSTIGFGSALVTMPLLGALLGVRTATAIVGILSVVSSLIITLVDRRHIDLRQSWRLTVASFLGVPIGLLLLRMVPEGLILKGLGIVLIAYGLFSLLSSRLRLGLRLADQRDYRWLAWPMGFAAGVLGGAYNTNGPPLVVFGVLNRWPPQQFRATLQSIFFTSGIIIAFGQWAAGLWTTQALTLAALAAPALPFAILLGRWLNQRIPQAVFTQVLYVFLIVLGTRLLFS